MRTHSTAIGFLLVLAVCLSESSSALGDTDRQEIAETSIARRLIGLGFVEDPPDNGVYQAKMTWEKAKETLGIREDALHSVPSGPPGEWIRTTEVDGEYAVLLHLFEEGKRAIMPDSVVNVSVNVGYRRPLCLTVGMSVDRLETALTFLGAKTVPVDPAKIVPTESRVRGVQVFAVTLRDGTALVATWQQRARLPQEKPTLPVVSGLFVGAVGRGFEGWNAGEVAQVQEFPIQKYRKAQGQR